MGGSSGKKGGGAELPFYHLSTHIGVCSATEGIELLRVEAGEKVLWEGVAQQNSVFDIDKKDLFGGDKKEGGVSGLMHVLLGAADQVLPAPLASRLGLTPTTAPGFRGIVSLFFTGRSGAGNPDGFYWLSNNPYLKTPSVRVRAPALGLNPSIAMIDLPDDSQGRQQKAANPAHMIFACLTNREWGKGASLGSLNIASYEAAAQTLYNEGFGMAMLWTRQASIEKFISEILDHIQAVHYSDPETGKLTLKLLRGDYDPNSLEIISPDNARLSNFQRKAWGEIANEVVVTWTNPETEKEETVTAHDLSAIAIQGGTVSTSRNYYGVRSQGLAMRLAQRDLAGSVHPIATCEAEIAYGIWKIVPGSVLRLNWPEHGINNVVMRVTEVAKGASGSSRLRFKMQEDIFGLDRADYGVPVNSEWTGGSVPPANLTAVKLGTAPLYMAHTTLGFSDPSQMEYPSAVAAILPVRPSQDYNGYELWAPVTQPNGAIEMESVGDRAFPASAVLADPLVQEASGTMTIQGRYGPEVTVGTFVVIGNVPDEEEEIAIVDAVADNVLTVSRGLLDTVPRAWAAGTRVWFLGASAFVHDATERVAYEVVPYRLLPRTGRGKLAYAAADELHLSVSDRAHLPFRPARVQVGGVSFGSFDASGLPAVDVTWRTRNRLAEATQVITWTASPVTEEPDQYTRVQILDDNLDVIWESDDIPGDYYALPTEHFGALDEAWVRVMAYRDGFYSLQGHMVRVVGVASALSLSGDEAGGEVLLGGDQTPGSLRL